MTVELGSFVFLLLHRGSTGQKLLIIFTCVMVTYNLSMCNLTLCIIIVIISAVFWRKVIFIYDYSVYVLSSFIV